MAEARQRAEWARAAEIVAKVHNCHCTEPIAAADVHPLLRDAAPQAPVETMTMAEVGELLGRKFPGRVEDG